MFEQKLEQFAENVEIFLGQAGFSKWELYESSYLKKFTPVCLELQAKGEYDESAVDPSSLYHFVIGVLYVYRMIGLCEADHDSDSSEFTDVFFSGLGYMHLYYPDWGADGLNTWEFERSMAALARMKLSSFRTALSAAGIKISDKDAVIEFTKSRRGFIELKLVNSDAATDNLTFDDDLFTLCSLARYLLRRAEWRGTSMGKMMSVLGADNEEQLRKALVAADNAATVSALLSLDLDSFASRLMSIELEETKAALEAKYTKAKKKIPSATAADLKSSDDRISPDEFVTLLGSGAKIHPNYRANKKLKAFTLADGREVAIEITTTKTVNIWLNNAHRSDVLEPFIKDEYERTSSSASVYGRHSALKIYPSLAWDPVIKLVIKNVGEATVVVNELVK